MGYHINDNQSTRKEAILPDNYEFKEGPDGTLELWKDGKHITNILEGMISILADEGKKGVLDIQVSSEGNYARLLWVREDQTEVHLVLTPNGVAVWQTGDEGEPSLLLTENGVKRVWSSLNSMAAVAKGDNPGLNAFIVPESPMYAEWEYNMLPISISSMVGGEVRGEAFRVRESGFIECRKDMYAVAVELILVGNWPANKNIVVGIGVGDPYYLTGNIMMPGEDNLPAYISRFVAAGAGRGDNRDVTLSVSAQPVGRGTTELNVFGVRDGDMLFPVIYAEEDTNTLIQIKDVIFVVREISV